MDSSFGRNIQMQNKMFKHCRSVDVSQQNVLYIYIFVYVYIYIFFLLSILYLLMH